MKCDSCGKEIEEKDAKYLSYRACCSVKRVPLCRDCWNKIMEVNKI
jgi:hypothetical protein